MNQFLFAAVFLALICRPCYGQFHREKYDIVYHIDSTFSWSAIDSWSTPEQRKAYLYKLYNQAEDYCGSRVEDYEPGFDRFWQNRKQDVHLVDFDGDMDFDVIYDGFICPGHEATSVEIFENVHGQLKSVLQTSGEVKNIHLKQKEVVIYSDPCCADVLNKIGHFSYHSDSLLTFVETARSLFVTDLEGMGASEFPESLTEETPFTLIDSTYLCWSPDTIIRFLEFPCKSNGANIVANYTRNSKGLILSRSKDRNWLYVLMENNPAVKNRCVLHNKYPFHSPRTYGWIRNTSAVKEEK